MPKISVYQKFKIILKKLVRANFPKRGFKFELNITESNYNNLIFNRIINNGNRTNMVCNHMSDKQNLSIKKCDLLIMSVMITGRIG